MATTANLAPGALGVGENGDSDPFLSTPQEPLRQRYSSFDNRLFSLYSDGSPSQTKRALEAHLTETERRLQEASQLGTVLVQQRKELNDRLKDVDQQQDQNEISPELRRKLADVEREFNEVGKETAKAFIPRSRVSSSESTADSIASGSVLSSEAQHSPSKLNVPPSRKQRNQAPSRVHDIKLATEISTSLLTQLRDLQGVLAEKDDALRNTSLEKSQLEVEVEGLNQRLRALDESEQRYKDENWSLEAQLHDLTASSKDSTDREQRLNQTLNAARAEKAAVEREYEELKQVHGKLNDDHATTKKQFDSELSALKRNYTVGETERGALQRKVDELTAQNGELARAVSYRLRGEDQDATREMTSESEDPDADNVTPEHSPPPSPSKGTPRHGHLESETLKSSLNHAQRMIQNLRNNIHREKTEKIELRRMLQDARDELEIKRGENGASALNSTGKKRRSANQQDVFKKPARPDRLGGVRSGKDEIVLEDGDWEDHDDPDTPSRAPTSRSRPGARAEIGGPSSAVDTANEGFETATENSEAFETANERDGTATETDAFQTGAETLDGDSSDDLTETETGGAQPLAQRRSKPPPVGVDKDASSRHSYLSTASTSDDEPGDLEAKTPVQAQHPRYRLKINRGGQRRSTRGSQAYVGSNDNTPSGKDSPASNISNQSPAPAAQSLFAELNNLSDDDSDEDSNAHETPSRSIVRSREVTPESSTKPSRSNTVKHAPKPRAPKMVDSGVMTDFSEPESHSTEVRSTTSEHPVPTVGDVSPAHGTTPSVTYTTTYEQQVPRQAPQVPLSVSSIASQHTAPIASKFNLAPSMQGTPVSTLDTMPDAPTRPAPSPPRSLELSSIVAQELVPTETKPQGIVAPQSADTSVAHHVDKTPHHDSSAANLSFSTMTMCHTEPVEPTHPATAQRSTASATNGSFGKENERDPSAAPEKSGVSDLFGSVLGWNKPAADPKRQIAEDETGEPARPRTRDSVPEKVAGRTPFKVIDGNAMQRDSSTQSDAPPRNQPFVADTADEGTQTLLSAEEIERLSMSKSFVSPAPRAESPSRPVVGLGSPKKAAGLSDPPLRNPRRPSSVSSVSSVRGRGISPPPLPPDHKEVIAAAAQKTPATPLPANQGAMGPPTMPASAYRTSQQLRPRTPSVGPPQGVTPNSKAGTTPRPRPHTARSDASTIVTRRSSVSSFASELDQRFNITRNPMALDGMDGGTSDPRMIQAITQTMIGEWLWKYTRKAGRGEMSENRHRRFFWVHPYTRTLYWSEHDSSNHARAELKAKSVPIEDVRVVTDDNNSPPGLHRKSLVVITPGRSIKFTAPTGQRHETWFNALSYLLLRTTVRQEDGHITAEDVNEFNPASYVRSSSRLTGRSRISLSSYNSRTTRNSSPSRAQIPTLTSRQSSGQRASQYQTSHAKQNRGSTSSRLSSIGTSIGNYIRPPSTTTTPADSRRSRQSRQESQIYDAPVVHDSAEDLRQVIEQQEVEADRLENVRACCDGKHDVSSLSRKGRHASHNHRHSQSGHTHTHSQSNGQAVDAV